MLVQDNVNPVATYEVEETEEIAEADENSYDDHTSPFCERLAVWCFTYITIAASVSTVCFGVFGFVSALWHFTPKLSPKIETIDGAVELALDCHSAALPGVTVALIKDNSVMYNKAYGYVESSKKVKVDPYQTMFGIGSITKSMTAALALQLLEEKGLNSEHAVNMNLMDERVTMIDMMSHRTGMPQTDFIRFKPGYDREQVRIKWNSLSAADAVMSTSSDMVQWMYVLLNNGTSSANKEIFSPGVVKSLFKPRVVMPETHNLSRAIFMPRTPVTFADTGLAGGLRTALYRDHEVIWQIGSEIGYSSIMFLLPNKNIGIFISFNGQDREQRALLALSFYIVDLLLGNEPWLSIETLCTYPQPWIPSGKDYRLPKAGKSNAIEKPAQYVGRYKESHFGEVKISLNSLTDELEIVFGFLRGILLPMILFGDAVEDAFILEGKGGTWYYGEGSWVIFVKHAGVVDELIVGGFTEYYQFTKM